MNTTPEHAASSETFIASLRDLGSAWARYGLRLGSVALEAHSKQLEAVGRVLGEAVAGTAKTLGDLADTFATPKADKPASEPIDGVIAE